MLRDADEGVKRAGGNNKPGLVVESRASRASRGLTPSATSREFRVEGNVGVSAVEAAQRSGRRQRLLQRLTAREAPDRSLLPHLCRDPRTPACHCHVSARDALACVMARRV